MAYADLLLLTDVGSEDHDTDFKATERADLGQNLRNWYYKNGAGLLLSGRALERFEAVRRTLSNDQAAVAEIRRELSRLRTDLKIDLGVRQPQERDVTMAWPEEDRW